MTERTPLLQILKAPPTPQPAPASTVDWSAVAERMRAIATRPRATDERCDMCGAPITEEHAHIVNVAQHALLCACRPCYLLFTHEGAGGAHFRAVPDRYVDLSGGRPDLSGPAFLPIDVPIGLAFFFRSSLTGRTTAFYPSPVGATESDVPPDAWERCVAELPSLSTLLDDVEALLVRRRHDDAIAMIVPIDACYELVGLIRRSWRGFQGGDIVWREVDEFFARALDRARRTAV